MINHVIDSQLSRLQDRSYHPGDILKNSNLASVFSQRINIPDGTCNFSLPRFHYWLKKSEFERKQDLIDWLSDLIPIKESSHMLLDNIRKSSTPTYENAKSGFYHRQVGTNIFCQLIRVNMSSTSSYYPDISGVKHRFTIRFMAAPNSNIRPTQTQSDIHFELHCCIL
jgi:cell division protein ZapD